MYTTYIIEPKFEYWDRFLFVTIVVSYVEIKKYNYSLLFFFSRRETLKYNSLHCLLS